MEESYLNRREAAAYLNAHGLPVTANSLEKFATAGGGPRYAIFGNRALYTAKDLEAWVVGRMKPNSSTKEGRAND